jgi:hypothetical protein
MFLYSSLKKVSKTQRKINGSTMQAYFETLKAYIYEKIYVLELDVRNIR